MKNGFVALISVILISSALLAAVLVDFNNISVTFDEANHKQYRRNATESALACLDRALLELTHDYFFEVDASTPASYPTDHCTIVSVIDTPDPPVGSGNVNITVSGNSNGVTVTVVVQALLSTGVIHLVSEKTFF